MDTSQLLSTIWTWSHFRIIEDDSSHHQTCVLVIRHRIFYKLIKKNVNGQSLWFFCRKRTFKKVINFQFPVDLLSSCLNIKHQVYILCSYWYVYFRIYCLNIKDFFRLGEEQILRRWNQSVIIAKWLIYYYCFPYAIHFVPTLFEGRIIMQLMSFLSCQSLLKIILNKNLSQKEK